MLPVWTVAVAGAWLAAVLVSGAVASAARRRAAAAPTSAAVALPPRAHRVATEVFDGRVARLTAGAAERPAVRARRPSGPSRTTAEPADDAWTPVEVPSPVYASKPVSHRPPALPWSMPAGRRPRGRCRRDRPATCAGAVAGRPPRSSRVEERRSASA